MRGRRCEILLLVVVSLSFMLIVPSHALAYVGPGPGVELIPYFYSLLAWVGLALGSVFLWPIHALFLHLWKGQPRVAEVVQNSSDGASGARSPARKDGAGCLSAAAPQ